LDDDRPPDIRGNVAIFCHRQLSEPVLRSTLIYASMLNDCFPFSLHLPTPLTPVTRDCLKRVFRSLDSDFNSMISLADLSNFNSAIFGAELSSNDLICIFRLLQEAEPLQIDAATYLITFDEFERLCQHLVSFGYGHVVFNLIENSLFHKFIDSQFRYVFSGEPSRMISDQIGIFVSRIFTEFPEFPIHKQLVDVFAMQGGAPVRVLTTRFASVDDWIRFWVDWCVLEPNEAARNLLALGFPIEKVNEAFGVVPEERTSYSKVLGSMGLAAVAVGAAFLVKFKFGR
jgi:hypothetical protein